MTPAATAHRPFVVPRASRALVDLLTATAALAASLAFLSHGIAGARPHAELDALGTTLAACAASPLLAWRRFPVGVFLLSAATSTLAAVLGYSLGVAPAPTVALYLLAASRDEEDPWRPRNSAAVVALAVAYLSAIAAANREIPQLEIFHTALAWTAAWFAGERTRLRRQQISDLEERARRAEREADQDRRLATAEERARIARDLHDSAGHAINVIAVRAGAARLHHPDDPGRSLRALETIEHVAREAADDIDQIVHVLREGTAVEGVPIIPHGLASLATLVTHHAQAGLKVAVHSSGRPRTLAHATDQAVYRILQEALTNAARHGTGTADVELSFRDSDLELTISNPVRGAGERRVAGGHGLIGMRERTILLGGSMRAKRVDGTFRVRALLPYESDHR